MPDYIDRSPGGFLDALQKRLEETLKSYWHEGEHPDDEEYHIPIVHIQDLPVSKTETEERDKSKDCPYVILVCTGGKVGNFSDAALGSEMNVLIYFCCFSESLDNQGWRLPTNMIWRVMQDLLSNKIVEGYLLAAPIEWSPLNSKEPPYYTALMETTWKGAPPGIEVSVLGFPDSFEGSLKEDDSVRNEIEEQFEALS